jgi:tetratricopeptide (TPR) repeat protein
MAIDILEPEVILPDGFDVRWEAEMADKGFLNNVIVQTAAGGSRYRVNFIDPIRLQQDLAIEAQTGCPYFTEPGLIVLPEITLPAIETAVARLWREGYFDSLRPVDEEIPHPLQLAREAQVQLASALETGGDRQSSILEAMVQFRMAVNTARELQKLVLIMFGDNAGVSGQYDLALQCYDEALQVDPDSTVTWMRRGLHTFESNRQTALQDFRKAISNPRLLFPRYYLAYDAFSSDDFQEGLRLCEEALHIREVDDVPSDLIPKLHADVLNWEASLRFRLGEPVESIKLILERAAKLDPLDPVIQQNLDALEHSDDLLRTAVEWRVNDAVDPHEAVRGIPLGRTA